MKKNWLIMRRLSDDELNEAILKYGDRINIIIKRRNRWNCQHTISEMERTGKRNRNGSHPGSFFYAATDRVMPVRQVKFCEAQRK